jgi:hypothetical protein
MKTLSVLRLLIAALALSVSATPATKRTPVPKGAGDPGSIVPQLVDGTQYRTIIYILNLGTAAQNYKLNIMKENGSTGAFHFAEIGALASSLSGTLQPLGTAVYHTDGGATAAYQVGWAETDFLGSGVSIKVYEVIESSDPLTGNWTTQSMVGGDEQLTSDESPIKIPFDQTSGFVCGIAVVNTDYEAASMVVEILGPTGLVVESAPLTLNVGQHVQFVVKDTFPLSAGIVGIVRIRNANPGSFYLLAAMGIKATAYKSGWTQTSLPVIN